MNWAPRIVCVAFLAGNALPQVGVAAGQSASLTKERTQECSAAIDRIKKEAAKGADASFDPTDERVMEYCRQAFVARNVLTVAGTPARTKGIDRQLLQRLQDAANRIVAELNGHGVKAAYAPADIRLIENFTIALSAVACLAQAAICPQVEAKRVIAMFNEKGSEASFSGGDERALREFHERKGKRQ